jgi:uncharacterized protein (UPF0179 family)
VFGRVLIAALGWWSAACWAEGTAVIADSVVTDGRSAGQFFFVESVDGRPTPLNNLDATARASRGTGANMRVQAVERSLPAGPVKLGLATRGHHVVPIVGLFSSGSRISESAVVDVELKPGVRYRVTGIVDAYRHELWLEEEDSQAVVAGSKAVFAFVGEKDAKLMAGALFTCCNLHYDGDWISDANWTTAPMIPAGARIKVVEIGRNKAAVLINGRKLRVGLDYGRKQMSTEQFVAGLQVADDPMQRVATLPPALQAAVRAGQVMVGMSKEDVIVALGRPRADETASTQSDEWHYQTLDEDPIVLHFAADGRLAAVDAPPAVAKLVVHAP